MARRDGDCPSVSRRWLLRSFAERMILLLLGLLTGMWRAPSSTSVRVLMHWTLRLDAWMLIRRGRLLGRAQCATRAALVLVHGTAVQMDLVSDRGR